MNAAQLKSMGVWPFISFWSGFCLKYLLPKQKGDLTVHEDFGTFASMLLSKYTLTNCRVCMWQSCRN